MQTPTLILPGRDLAHPEEIALETARLAPNAELKLGWQQDLPAAASAVRLFLQAHTRVSTSEASPGQATWTNEQIVAPQVPVFISRERGADGGLRAISRVQAWTILKVVSEQAAARALALRASHHGAAGEPASAHPHLFRHSRVRQIVSTTRSLPLGTCHPWPRRGIHVRGKTCLALTGGERTPLAGKGSSW